jgi:outer membrane scaffolding protein for murein synthesis (MipA/OmpV family)
LPPTPAAAGDSFSAGVGLAYVPEYAGADKSRVCRCLSSNAPYANGVFLSTQRGIGYETKVGDFKLSAALVMTAAARTTRKTTSPARTR